MGHSDCSMLLHYVILLKGFKLNSDVMVIVGGLLLHNNGMNNHSKYNGITSTQQKLMKNQLTFKRDWDLYCGMLDPHVQKYFYVQSPCSPSQM